MSCEVQTPLECLLPVKRATKLNAKNSSLTFEKISKKSLHRVISNSDSQSGRDSSDGRMGA